VEAAPVGMSRLMAARVFCGKIRKNSVVSQFEI
jgi:hypothetical protein